MSWLDESIYVRFSPVPSWKLHPWVQFAQRQWRKYQRSRQHCGLVLMPISLVSGERQMRLWVMNRLTTTTGPALTRAFVQFGASCAEAEVGFRDFCEAWRRTAPGEIGRIDEGA